MIVLAVAIPVSAVLVGIVVTVVLCKKKAVKTVRTGWCVCVCVCARARVLARACVHVSVAVVITTAVTSMLRFRHCHVILLLLLCNFYLIQVSPFHQRHVN